MKKNIVLIVLIIASIFLLCPQKLQAKTTDITSIDEKINLIEEQGFELSRVQINYFKDGLYPTFGLSSIISNNNSFDVDYSINVTYYNQDKKEVYKEEFTGTQPAKTDNSFSRLNTIDDDTTYNPDDIKYYKLDIKINNDKNLANTNNNYDYVINNYDVNINVNDNNSYDITETITAYFNVDKHGIFRKLPLKNTITRQDGTTSTNRAKITNIKVNENFTTSTESGYKVIKIGNPNYTLTGQKEYKLNYTYNIGKDTGKGYDELYFNIIGDEWDTTIDNVTFYITLPKEFDKTKLGFTSGKTNTIDTSNIEYSIDGKTITGKLTKKLDPYEALTIRLELPEGYFINSNEINIFTIICFLVPLLFLFISWYKWNKYGKDDIVVETVEFYPPEGYNSAEVGFLYKGRAQPKDVTSLLIYLANNGYIKISETEEKKKDNYTIIKVKDYDGNNDNEKTFMEGLFKNGRTEVTKDMLYNDFYITNNQILTNINNKENKNKIYDITANKNRKVIILLIILTICITFGLPCYEYSSLSDAISIVFMIAIYTIFYVTLLSNKIPIAVRIIGLIFITFHMCFMLQITTIIDAISYNPYYLITTIIGIISLIGLIIFFKIMPKRTKFGTDILGKIKGLKNFLETAEKDKLEAMVEKDPTYFYNILPFTYVLGISDKWIKKFEDINIQAPEWYDSNNAFDSNNFNHFMNNTINSASSAMTSSPSSDSSSSGGGFSGGGSGGGGGGSW